MKIRIIDTVWGINRMTGQRSERVVADETFELSLGTLPPIGTANKQFEVTNITDCDIALLVNQQGRTLTIPIGEPYVYRPMSLDGGHYYTITIQ